jgi:hypothetical protein
MTTANVIQAPYFREGDSKSTVDKLFKSQIRLKLSLYTNTEDEDCKSII